MPYVIKREEDGKYVSRPGSANSYARLLQQSRTWPTREAAERERCGNEYIVDTDAELGVR